MMTAGDLKPDLTITIGDATSLAVFTNVTTSQVKIICVQNGQKVFEEEPDVFTPSDDGKTATLSRAWVSGETSRVGRMYISVMIIWPNDAPQTFPSEGWLILDVRDALVAN